MNVGIRPATDNDIGAIRAIDPSPQHPERPGWLAERVGAGRCLVAVIEGEVVGYVVLDHAFFLMGFVEMLRVAETHRRQGIATALMTRVEALCTTDRLFTSTNVSNAPMHALLPRLGYAPCGTIDLDPGDAEIVYVKRLKDQAI